MTRSFFQLRVALPSLATCSAQYKQVGTSYLVEGGESKVRYLECAIFGKEQVLGFQIAVADSQRVTVIDSFKRKAG